MMETPNARQRTKPNGNGVVKDLNQTTPSNPKATTSSLATPSLILLWSSILVYIFGGCCSNVWALESIINHAPSSGYLITFTQFLLTTVASAWPHVRLSSSFPYVLRQPRVPLLEWVPNILLFLSVNVLNNVAFGYKISVPVHIILRSGGSVTTMLVGGLLGRRYSKGQVAGVGLLTGGVVVAAMADAKTKGKNMSAGSDTDMQSFMTGLIILFVAQVLSALMGIRTQAVYAKHGPHWQENLFYSHLLSLPFFLFSPSKILEPLAQLSSSRISTFGVGSLVRFQLPQQVVMLLANAFTQLFCILGVNRLGAVTTALGVTIVLNIRKLVSLFLSTWLYGTTLPPGVWAGAFLVFLGGGVYAGGDKWLESRRKDKTELKKNR